jgi:hypothetical protein
MASWGVLWWRWEGGRDGGDDGVLAVVVVVGMPVNGRKEVGVPAISEKLGDLTARSRAWTTLRKQQTPRHPTSRPKHQGHGVRIGQDIID